MSELHQILFRLAHQDEGFRQALIRHLRAGVDRHVAIKDLPDALQKHLRAMGYGKRDIAVAPADDFVPNSGLGGSGRRSMLVLINLATGQSKEFIGSWGGANMFTKTVADDDNRHTSIPPNHAVISGSGTTKLDYARILIHPSNFALMVEGPKEELSDQAQQALNAIVGLKPGARADEFRRWGLGDYNLANPLIVELLQKKLLENKGGKIFVTTEGRNRRTRNW